MDQLKREPTLEESIKQQMDILPPPIRRYLAAGKHSVAAQNLMKKYSLHIDQGGILEREIVLLLMGIENPDEFVKSLKEEAAIPEDVLRNIVIDINQEVFAPLRQEEMTTGMGNMTPRTNVPISNSTHPRYFHLENKLPARPRQPASPAASLPPKVVMPRSRLLEDHEEPHIEFNKPAAPPSPAPPPMNLPGVTPPKAAPVAPLRPPLPAALQVESPGVAKPKPVAPAAPYPVDPYREPIE